MKVTKQVFITKTNLNRKGRKESAKDAKGNNSFSVNCDLCENTLRLLR